MTTPAITMIYAYNVMKVWDEAVPLLGPAIALSGTHEIEDVRKALLCGQANLWGQWNDGLEAAVITEFVNYPKGVWLRIWLGGAKNIADINWEEMKNTIFKFAYDNKCAGVEDWGRGGWARICPEARKEAVILRVEFKYPEMVEKAA